MKLFRMGDMALLYHDECMPWFGVYPYAKVERLFSNGKCSMEKFLERFPDFSPEPMVQIALSGFQGTRDLSAGKTLRNNEAAKHLKVKERKVSDNEIVTVLCLEENGVSVTVEHVVKNIGSALECYVRILNKGETVVLELADSFALSNLTMLSEFKPSKIKIRRFRSAWSNEAHLEEFTAEDWLLCKSWSGYGTRLERFGVTGSMPCNGYFPYVSVEDEQANTCWNVYFEAPMSWQCEVFYSGKKFGVAGGIADAICGWRRKLDKDSVYETFHAYIACSDKGFNDCCQNIVTAFRDKMQIKETEKNMPVIYNEYCTSWGMPDMKTMVPFIKDCEKFGTGIFVMDAGWYSESRELEWRHLGDWLYDKNRFPRGVKAFCDTVKKSGMIPGVWFEFESCSIDSDLFKEHPDWLLTRDGYVITCRDRAFLDFRKTEVIEYLRERVIKFLKENEFLYLKLDYNESIGYGVDGGFTPVSAMEDHLRCVHAFCKELKNNIPELVFEVCSAGGMREEPYFNSLGDQFSFSDAHEGIEGAAIAASLHRCLPPAKMQIWATLRPEMSNARFKQTLIKSMLGRICLSGDLTILSEERRNEINNALAFYRQISDIISSGRTVYIDDRNITGFSELSGDLTLIRCSKDGKRAVAFFFGFETNKNRFSIANKLFQKAKILSAYGCKGVNLEGDCLNVSCYCDECSAGVVLLEVNGEN